MIIFQILALADLHGNTCATQKVIDYLILENIQISLIVIVGDLPATTSAPIMLEYMIKHPLRALSKKGYTKWVYKGKGRKKFVKKQVESVKKILKSLSYLKVPIVYIPGNVDSHEALNVIRGWQDTIVHVLDSHPFKIKNLSIAGIGGAILPFNQSEPLCDHEYFEKIYDQKWKTLLKNMGEESLNIDIVVSHEPPKFTAMQNNEIVLKGGSKAVSGVINDKNPRLVIFGHFHELQMIKKYDRITYVNPGPLACYQFAIIDIKAENIGGSIINLPPMKFDNTNMIYKRRTVENTPYHSLTFVKP